jgi:hypothetical protein
MAAERRGSTLRDVGEHTTLLTAEAMPSLERGAVLANDLADVESRAPGV